MAELVIVAAALPGNPKPWCYSGNDEWTGVDRENKVLVSYLLHLSYYIKFKQINGHKGASRW